MSKNNVEDVNSLKLTKWVNEPTVSDLKSDLTAAKSSQSTQISMIDDWLDMLNVEGVHKPKTRKGRSSVQPKLVRKQAEWRYSALTEPFLDNKDMFTVSPRTFKDREAANQNSLVLNYQFSSQIDKVNFIDTYVRTAVNEGTVIARICWEYEEKKVKRDVPVYDYQEADPQEASIIQAAMQLEDTSELDESIIESIKATQENGRPIIAIPTGDMETIEEIEVVKNQPGLTICDYRNITIDPTCGSEFDKANFIIDSFEASKSDLERTGLYKNLDKITVADRADGTHHSKDQDFNFSDESRKKFVVYEYWGYWDIDDSGITTPIVATWVGDVMIRMEVNPYPDQKLPFVVIPYLPVKDSVYGEPDAALLEDNQKLIGALTRGMIDSMARSANGQMGIRKDMLDAVQRRKFDNGDDYEFNPNVDPRQGIVEHQYPELPTSSYNMLQMFSADADSITGIKSFTGGLSGDSLGQTATGITGVMGAQAKRELNILRRLGEGIEKIGKKILAMNAEFLSDEEVIRITDEEFVTINRDNLKGTFDVELGISTAETDQIKAQELSFMMQTMGQSLPFELSKLILSEIAKLRKMPDLAKNIDSYQPEPDPVQQQLKQLELQNIQLKNQLVQAQIQETMANTQKLLGASNTDVAKARNLEADTNLKNLDFVEQESGVTQERKLQHMQAQAKGNMQRDVLNVALNSTTKGIM